DGFGKVGNAVSKHTPGSAPPAHRSDGAAFGPDRAKAVAGSPDRGPSSGMMGGIREEAPGMAKSESAPPPSAAAASAMAGAERPRTRQNAPPAGILTAGSFDDN